MTSRITAITWDTYSAALHAVERRHGVEVDVFSRHEFDTMPGAADRAIASMEKADLILLYHTGQPYWESMDSAIDDLRKRKKIVSVGTEPMDFAPGNVEPRIALEAYRYLTNGGTENMGRLLDFLKRECLGYDCEVLPPMDIPWHGLTHPDHPERFDTLEEYMDWYPEKKGAPWIGVAMSRSGYITDRALLEYEFVRVLESRGANVILFYTMSTHDDSRGSISIGEAMERYMMRDGKSVVEAVVKLISFLVGNTHGAPAAEFFKKLDIPVFQPVVANNISREAFEVAPGLAADISWSVAFPEFEGAIEPIILGFTRDRDGGERNRVWIEERMGRIADRVLERVELRRKPNSEKRIVFLLNNYPCAGAEANIGGASHLDTHRTMRNVLQAMRDAGYDVEVPESGKALIDNILEHKAMSDFRWTSKEEIAKCGGVYRYVTAKEYRGFFDTLSPKVRQNVIDAWGEPPGEAMVIEDRILVTGLQYGNAIIGVQPKRGCYGSKCDGTVCKILHDPLCPPTHQYLATYHYYEDVWGADAVIHVGTHGNLEFLPGKSVGMTGDCFPDIVIGRKPHIYIYNADNPPEGTIAKRRSCATLVDHMQTVMIGAGLYSDMEALDGLLEGYESAEADPSRAHQYKHMILEAAEKAHFDNLGLNHDMSLGHIVRLCHEELSKVRNSQMDLGMHVFGEIPQGDMRAELINSVMRYDAGDGCIRDVVAECYGASLKDLYADQGVYNIKFGTDNGHAIERIGKDALGLISAVLRGEDILDAAGSLGLFPGRDGGERLREYQGSILRISADMDASDELGSFIHALDGGFTEPGPSGLITRGRPDILPTGRNFYSLDPRRVPTPASWKVGIILAEDTIKKYEEDTGETPESVAFYWMSNDVMMAGGEAMSQIMYLIGVKPVWASNGQVNSYAVIPLEELGRPRIDVTVRTSGILRDNFINCIDLVDSAVRELAELDEPPEMNFIRKHTLDSRVAGIDEEQSTARVFSAPPGSYASGVNLAVYASAWKTEKDLAEIYIAGSGYAYGNGRNGKEAHEQFASSLSKVSVTYNKIISDEHDLLGCCCYFSNQGGLTAASRHLSGRDVKTYYGDTREPNDINVHSLADEIRRVVRTKLLNPRWIDGMKEHGYKGCADMMKRIGRVYGFEAGTQQVDDWIFDDIANTFVNDEEMREFYKENNPYALEEIARRLLEANQRGLWEADEEALDQLRENYVEIEGWMEDLAGDGEHQGGSIDIVTAEDVEAWNRSIAPVMEKVREMMGKRGGSA